MPSATRPRRSQTPAAGRFARPGAASRPRPRAMPGRAPAPQRRGVAGGWMQRGRKPEPSGLRGMLSGTMGKGRAATPSKGKAGGLALLAGVAGFAFKNRDKVTSMVRRRRSGDAPPAPGEPPRP